MNKKQFIEHLAKFPDDTEIMVLDSFNGGGSKRDINFTPSQLRTITQEDEEECGDCKGRVGENVILIGFGFY